jgi:hypothetical protein
MKTDYSSINIFKNKDDKYDIKLIIVNLAISFLITLLWLYSSFLALQKFAGYDQLYPNVGSLMLGFFRPSIANILTFILIYIMWSLFRKNKLKW